MKNEYLAKHLANIDLSFIKGKKNPIKQVQPIDWDKEIEQLEKFFNSIELPTEPIQLNQCSIINSGSDFIEGHLQASRTYNGKRIGQPYLDRLKQLQVMLN